MGQQKIRKQHYVPQFYLRHFSSNEKVIVCDKKSMQIFKSNIRDVCCKNHLYETEWGKPMSAMGNYILYNDLETDLSRKESEYAPLLSSIIKICCNESNLKALICYKDEREVLCSFLTNLFCRSKWYIQDVDNEVRNERISNSHDLKEYRETVEIFGLGDFEAYVRAATKRAALNDKVEGSSAHMLKRQLEMMEFCFFTTQKESFVTADFPFICTFSECEETVLSTLFCPLHPKVGVVFLEPGTHKELHKFRNTVCRVDEETAMKLNRIMLSVEQIGYLISGKQSLLDQVIALS